MQIKDITALIEKIAPLSLQEDYDNAGLIVGNAETDVTGIMLCLDITENIITEAVSNGCNLIVAHHPIIFKGLKKLNGSNYVERTVIKAIREGVALYAAHTNLDNVLENGVNQKIARKLGLDNLKILRPASDTLCKLTVFTPTAHAAEVRNCLFENGAGEIGNYSECSYNSSGMGSFKPGPGAAPYSGVKGERSETDEVKIEVLLHNHQINKVLNSVKQVHPYEEMAYDIIALKNTDHTIGAGIYGSLPAKMEASDFLNHLKDKMNLGLIRHTAYSKPIETVAICGGSGSFLIQDAKAVQADAYITGDIKYHEFFDAEDRLMLCDIGHYESEIFTLEIFYDVIKEKYPTFAVIFCKENTNPIQYFK